MRLQFERKTDTEAVRHNVQRRQNTNTVAVNLDESHGEGHKRFRQMVLTWWRVTYDRVAPEHSRAAERYSRHFITSTMLAPLIHAPKYGLVTPRTARCREAPFTA